MSRMSFGKIRLKHQILSDRLKSKGKKSKRRLVCDTCEEKFSSWWEIWGHWKSTGHKLPESCRWCSKKTYTLQSHLCKQHCQLATMCRFCGQLFMFAEDNERHQLSHDGTTYRCHYCGRRRRCEQMLREHVMAHYNEDRYGCTVCEKRFKKKKNLEIHLKRVHFLCQYCGIKTENYAELRKHVKDHDNLWCIHCNKFFSQKNRLKYHFQIIHSHQDGYKCMTCVRRFPTKSRLLDHVNLIHKGKANFRCETCQKPFLYKQQYVNHVNTAHVKSTPDDSFICRFCGFTTNKKIKLRWHLERTTGLGFQCNICHAMLDCKGLYDKHLKTHGRNVLFRCDVCLQNYSSDVSLRHHVSWKHPEVVMAQNPRGFPCLELGCFKYYATKTSLARHVRRVHSEVEAPKLKQVAKAQLVSGKKKRCSKNMKGNKKIKKAGSQRSGKENNPARVVLQANEPEVKSEVSVYYCGCCEKTWFSGEEQFKKHLASHGKKVWHEQCETCDQILDTPEDAVKHYVEDHLKAEFIS